MMVSTKFDPVAQQECRACQEGALGLLCPQWQRPEQPKEGGGPAPGPPPPPCTLPSAEGKRPDEALGHPP